MWRQKSFEKEDEKGILYLVPTPIGNLEDMSFRAIRILKEADVIAAEDTRNTKKLLHYYDIKTPVVSYHEHNKRSSGARLLEKLRNGEKIALVSDAGMPVISDPGYDLVRAAVEEKLTVVPLPGANAALTALVASGLQPQPFYFYGFLPRQKKERDAALWELSRQTATIILYEAPHRLKETLEALAGQLGNRKIVLCRELTKKFEEFIRGTLEEALQWAKEEEPRGEFCLIIEGKRTDDADEAAWWQELSIKEHVDHHIRQGASSKEAIKLVAKERGLKKRDVYQTYHIDN